LVAIFSWLEEERMSKKNRSKDPKEIAKKAAKHLAKRRAKHNGNNVVGPRVPRYRP
jgi:hypothetical protein